MHELCFNSLTTLFFFHINVKFSKEIWKYQNYNTNKGIKFRSQMRSFKIKQLSGLWLIMHLSSWPIFHWFFTANDIGILRKNVLDKRASNRKLSD